MSRKAMTSGVDKMTYEGGNVFWGRNGSEAISSIEMEGCERRVNDGAAGGNAEAMLQKGHDGSALGRGGGPDVIPGTLYLSSD